MTVDSGFVRHPRSTDAPRGPRTLVRGAAVVTLDKELGDFEQADILIDGDTISMVAPKLEVDDAKVVDASRMIAIPGFVDTHRHTWQSAMRHGYAEMDPLQYFVDVLQGIGAAYSPEDVYIGTLLGAASALNAGTTTLVDWSHIQNSPEHSDAAISALADSGIRAVFAHGWPLTTDDRWTKDSPLPHPADIERLNKQYFAGGNPLLTLAMAARGPEMTLPTIWRADLELARALGIRTSVHVGAYPHNAAHHAVAQYGRAGLLGADMTFVHCCGCTDAELAMIADAGASVSLGVHCEMNSQGIGDIPLDRLLSIGLRPSLSGDTETKCTGDMFTQMRLLYAYYRSWRGGGHSTVPTPPDLRLRDVLEFATIEGARAAGLDDRVGTITPGKQADLILIRATDVNLAPVLDPVAAVVLSAHEGNVDSVLVAGDFVKANGHPVRLDHHALIRKAMISQKRVLGRSVNV